MLNASLVLLTTAGLRYTVLIFPTRSTKDSWVSCCLTPCEILMKNAWEYFRIIHYKITKSCCASLFFFFAVQILIQHSAQVTIKYMNAFPNKKWSFPTGAVSCQLSSCLPLFIFLLFPFASSWQISMECFFPLFAILQEQKKRKLGGKKDSDFKV